MFSSRSAQPSRTGAQKLPPTQKAASGSSLAAAFPAALGWLAKVPTQLYQALPFLITAVVLVVTSIRKREGSGQPAALGLNYFREER